jgi:diacylglycerol kinase (ATP)
VRGRSVVIKSLRMRAAAIFGLGSVARTVAEFQRRAAAEWTSLIEQADVAVLFGGDGTVHHQLSTLVELDIPVLVIPCGSGNDFARALGLRSVSDAVAAWRGFCDNQQNVRVIDLGVICAAPGQRHYFCCVAGVGIDTAIAASANKLPRWLRARGGYALCAPREFLRFKPFQLSVSANGCAPSQQSVLLAAVANAPAYGGGMKIAPQAKLDDGKLDLCVVSGMGRAKLFSLFPNVYSGQHLRFKEVSYQQITHLRMETEQPRDVFADGEFVCQTPVELGVAPKALQVVIPPDRS